MTTCSIAISLLLDNVLDDPYDQLQLRWFYNQLGASRSNVRLSPSYRYPPYLHRRTGQTTSCPWDSQSCQYDINGPYLTSSRRPHGGITSQTFSMPAPYASPEGDVTSFHQQPAPLATYIIGLPGEPAIPVEGDPFARHQPIFVGRWLEFLS